MVDLWDWLCIPYTVIGCGENRGSKLSNQRSAICCWAIADWLRMQRSYWLVSIRDFPRIRCMRKACFVCIKIDEKMNSVGKSQLMFIWWAHWSVYVLMLYYRFHSGQVVHTSTLTVCLSGKCLIFWVVVLCRADEEGACVDCGQRHSRIDQSTDIGSDRKEGVAVSHLKCVRVDAIGSTLGKLFTHRHLIVNIKYECLPLCTVVVSIRCTHSWL